MNKLVCRRRQVVAWCLVATSLFATTALAREFWLAPASYRVAVGATVPLRLLIGDNFMGESWPRPTRRVARFVRLGPTDSTNLRPALLADSVAPALRCPAPGTHVVVLVSRLAFSELPAEQFTAYLREAGLDAALQKRKERGETTKPGREAYRRCAKTVLLAGAASVTDTAYRRALGLPLELIPEQNPYRLQPGAALTVRLLRAGQPVAGALVQVWDASAGPRGHFSTRTNRAGRVLLRLPGAGPYLVAAVQAEAAPPALATRADWLSTWASLTFGGPAARAIQTN